MSLNDSNQLSDAEIASRNITKMVLFVLLTYYIGYLPYIFYQLMRTSNFKRNIFYSFFKYLSILLKQITISFTIFIYYFFNKEYRKKFKIYFNKILRRH
jgi:uncharacterized membrane protein